MAAVNPFVVLSYVGGPALLTNATSVFITSTSTRFARAIDRARALAESDVPPTPDRIDELRNVHRRVDLIARAMSCLYFAAAMFALGTLGSIVGAVVSGIQAAPILDLVVVGAAAASIAGFVAFVIAAGSLVAESLIAARAVAREADAVLARFEREQ